MIENDFYSTIKLKSGEEIFTKVAASEEEDRTMLILDHPVTIESVERNGNLIGYKLEPWLKTTSEETFILNLDNVMLISESSDIAIIEIYQNFVRSFNRAKNPGEHPSIDRRMGYLSTVKDAKQLLEKIFKQNSADKNLSKDS